MVSKTNGDNSRSKVDLYNPVAPFYDFLTGSVLKPARKGIVRGAETHCRRILDVACGTGEQARMLARAGVDVTGIDMSPAMLEMARVNSPRTVGYILGNTEALPLGSGSFDCVSISLALHEMGPETRMKTMGEILRVLTPCGKLFVLDYAGPENWKAAVGLSFLGLVERIAGGEHFKNFVQFTRTGGIDQFLSAFPLKVIKSQTYFLGALRLIFLKKAPE
ncbi:putative Methyltransferase type 11 [Syntrophobacter sp. SbD1]|nr:putative Methyltransferase type 11 [Syntrophobacter sp. SbD1]